MSMQFGILFLFCTWSLANNCKYLGDTDKSLLFASPKQDGWATRKVIFPS